ncbi:alpha-galactosidase [Horticoccus luteus]|uniref:Alpha-galactosidase n=1 Tax=Horticoccus luteus TaxID=2862869 RepID=A0A8F9XK25_9BACT|nr:glycoside hydrolase family 36 protein [Horticoccus luteus]QYM79268.1 alpha-galactosidase [Horticoccus luteus]
MASNVQPELFRKVRCGAITALYMRDPETKRLGLWLVPTAKAAKLPKRREVIDGVEFDAMLAATNGRLRAWHIESLVQVKALADEPPAGFAQGRTLRNSVTVDRLAFERQAVTRRGGATTVRTSFVHDRDGWRAHHELTWRAGASWLESTTTVENTSAAPVTLEMLASFSISGLAAFASDDAPERLRLHRIRAAWSTEGRLVTESFEDAQLEPSWSCYSVRAERFGAVGSLPVNGYFPFVAVEDSGAGVTWGAQVAHPGSWQMEVYRREDLGAISGGLADREFGHWMKTVAPGEQFTSPVAFVSAVAGGVEDVCAALTAAQERPLAQLPKSERALPVMFNEWATSWGDPRHENMVRLAERLRGSGVKYLVIDAGWYKPDAGSWGDAQGEWQANRAMYPQGLRATTEAIRAAGFVPGLWFEMEVVGSSSPLWNKTEWLLHRDGRPITGGTRRFLDLRQPAVVDYLTARVIGTLREGNFGYIKVDYNETIGFGVDGAESPGEGLRQHLAGVQAFFRKMRAELPDLVIENCSSGGHRLEPSMMALVAMGSFSDAHECREIPIIAANLHRVILPRQSQVWAVLRAEADLRRTAYVLASGFLGRLCFSGDYMTLRAEQHELVARSIALYREAAPVIARGRSHRYGPDVRAYRHARGWQAVVRIAPGGRTVLVVAHTFADPKTRELRVPLPPGKWKIAGELNEGGKGARIVDGEWRWRPGGEWAGCAVVLRR